MIRKHGKVVVTESEIRVEGFEVVGKTPPWLARKSISWAILKLIRERIRLVGLMARQSRRRQQKPL